MEIALLILAIICIVVGVVGSLLPVLPGSWICTVALILLHLSGYGRFSVSFLIIVSAISVLILIMDFFIPAWMAKKGGATKLGQRLALFGSVIGLFFGPVGIVLGPLIGAFVGEVLQRPTENKAAVKAAFYSFLGFLLGVGISLSWALLQAWWFFSQVVKNDALRGII